MPAYDFIVTFRLPDAEADPADFTDALFEAGCDDATPGVGKRGSIALDFTREAADALTAIRSAIADVGKAIPGATLLEVKPDLVNLSDIAETIGCSRQNMRKYAAGEMKNVTIPFPAPAFTGAPDLWHLAEVLDWLAVNTAMVVERETRDVAAASFALNLEVQTRRLKETRRARWG